MPLKFERIAMTDLRARPGEIVDRVAEGGAAYVVERKGHPLACIVPVSLFLPDIPQARIDQDYAELQEAFPDPITGPHVTLTDRRELEFKVAHTHADGTTAEIRITVPHGYPHVPPIARVDPMDLNAPHRWGDGALCIFGATTTWNPAVHGLLATLQMSREWLRNYDEWRRTGSWPSKEGA